METQMNPAEDPATVQHFLSLPKQLGELAGNLPATQPQSMEVGSRLGAILGHLKQKRIGSEEARDTLNRNMLVKNVEGFHASIRSLLDVSVKLICSAP
jgi:hypothetical protein